MDAAVLLLNLYLLFPVLNDSQVALTRAVMGFPNAENEFVLRREMNAFLDSISLESPETNELEENIDEEEEGETEADKIRLYTDVKNHLRLYEINSEAIAVSSPENENTSIVSVNDKYFTLTEFDDKYRKKIETKWNKAKSLDETNVIYKTEFFYDDTISRFETDYKKNILKKIFYTQKNLVNRIEYYRLPEVSKEEKNTESENEEPFLYKTEIYEYDNDDRVICETVKTKTKKTDFYDEEIIVDDEFKTQYIYKSNLETPDIKYYENSVLHLKREYKNETDYTETRYFDSNFKIITEFKDGIKVDEKIITPENIFGTF